MNLPVGLWMCVFEHIDFDDCDARSDVVQSYKDDRKDDPKDEPQNLDESGTDRYDNSTALATLPPFEIQLWAATRAFYGVNKNSRAAAQRLRLSQNFLFRCKVPTQLKFSARLPQTRYAPSVYLVARLPSCKDSRAGEREDRHVESFAREVRSAIYYGYNTPLYSKYLRVIRHVVLLPGKSQRNDCEERYAMRLTRVAKLVIEQFWERYKIEDGRVEVFL